MLFARADEPPRDAPLMAAEKLHSGSQTSSASSITTKSLVARTAAFRDTFTAWRTTAPEELREKDELPDSIHAVLNDRCQ
jgi:hypothetical protein